MNNETNGDFPAQLLCSTRSELTQNTSAALGLSARLDVGRVLSVTQTDICQVQQTKKYNLPRTREF